MNFPAPPDSLPDLLERAARSFPDRGVHVMDARGRSVTRRSFVELLDGARASARRWHGLGLQHGDPIARR